MRPYVVVVNAVQFVWFFTLSKYRFSDEGRACSGEFAKKVNDYNMIGLGLWIKFYIFSHILVYLFQKLVSIIIINRLEAEMEMNKRRITNKV